MRRSDERRYRRCRGRDRRREMGSAAPEPGPHEADPHRLYRDRDRGVLAGVCAGIADHFGFSLTGTRIATVILAFVLVPWVFLGYVLMAMILPTRPRPLYRDEEEQQFWRSVRRSPIATLSQVRHRYREIDVRLQRMERYVTSSRFDVDRDFQELEGGRGRRQRS